MNKTHGHRGANSPEYNSWRNMLDRCRNANNPGHDNYAGRGICVCLSWLAFENFLEDMGPRPEGTSIHRKDNDLGYYKDNCVWADATVQALNRRSNRLIQTASGPMIASIAARLAGISPKTLFRRISQGCPENKLLSPLRRQTHLDCVATSACRTSNETLSPT